MTEEKEKLVRLSGLGSLYAALPAEAKGVIAFLLVFFIFVGGMTLLGKLPSMLESKCWELQIKEGRVFKFNACKGEVVEITDKDLKAKK